MKKNKFNSNYSDYNNSNSDPDFDNSIRNTKINNINYINNNLNNNENCRIGLGSEPSDTEMSDEYDSNNPILY